MPLINQTFSQLITFTRASSATYVDARGLIQSASTNVPRFDYNPSTLAPRGILIEEQRTNLLTYSEQFDNAAWITDNATITANTVVAPDGTISADTLTTSGVSAVQRVRQNVTQTGQVTFSVYAKAGTAQFLQLLNGADGNCFANFNLSTGVIGTAGTGASSTISNVGSGWYRCTITYTLATSTNWQIYIAPSASAPYGQAFGATVASLFLWGAQLEAGSFATSYIPTVASQVTRSADVASVNNLSPWYNMNEGTLFAEYTPFAVTADSRFASIDDNTLANRMVIFGLSSSTRTLFQVRVSSVEQATLEYASTFTTNTTKSAGAYKVNDFAFSVNGATPATDTGGSIPTVTQLVIGGAGGTSSKANGHIRRIVFYPSRLSNANLQTITA